METWQIVVAIVVVAIAAVVVIAGRARAHLDDPPSSAQEPQRPHAMTVTELQKNFAHPAFIPETAAGDEGSSHFGGRPWLGEGQTWPECAQCTQPMTLLLQLNLDALPGGAPPQRSGGLAQVFACGAGHSEFTTRLVEADDGGELAGEDRAAAPVAGRTITSWQSVMDLPQWSELQAMNPMLGPEIEGYLKNGEHTHGGEKLGGWPAWTNGPRYPKCPDCAEPMELLFQLTKNLPADAAVAHLIRCRNHSTRLQLVLP